MKKKLIRVANQILTLEEKCQKGENVQENMGQMDKLINNLSSDEMLQIELYLEEKLQNKTINWQQ